MIPKSGFTPFFYLLKGFVGLVIGFCNSKQKNNKYKRIMAWAVYLRQSMLEEKVPWEQLFISGYLFAFF